MKNITIEPDTKRLRFSVRIRRTKYCDRRVFMEYKILFWDGAIVVGVEDGPRRVTKKRKEAWVAARQRINELRKHRLYVIQVTKKHINDGEGRNCSTCAISQALWHNQERMGLPKLDYTFRVTPYAAWVEADGITLTSDYSTPEGEPRERKLPPHKLPDMIWNRRRKGDFFKDDMVRFAMEFDDWYDSQFQSLKEWREERGYDDGERPFKPNPCVFVLDLDSFEPVAA